MHPEIKRAGTAKRKRDLGYTHIFPVEEGDVGHHFTNECVGGIPAEVHQKLTGGSRKHHRTKVLQWLKANDKKKYKIVLCVLAEESFKNALFLHRKNNLIVKYLPAIWISASLLFTPLGMIYL